jgi:hypothetical protein
MTVKSEHEIEALVRSFEDCTLRREQWSHREHLVVALCYVRRHMREEAASRMRLGIKRLNQSHGNVAGYHETITLAWIEVISRFLNERNRDQPLTELVDALQKECGDKNYLLRFYSKDRLMSDEARSRWVSPDLEEMGW